MLETLCFHRDSIVIDRDDGNMVFSQRFREFQIKQQKTIGFTCVFTEIQRCLMKNIVFLCAGSEILEIWMIFTLWTKTNIHSVKIVQISKISEPAQRKTMFFIKNLWISVKTQMKPIVFHCFSWNSLNLCENTMFPVSIWITIGFPLWRNSNGFPLWWNTNGFPLWPNTKEFLL